MSDETVVAPPALRVISGSPTPEELAAVTALLTAATGDEADSAPTVRRGTWNDPARQQRRELLPGPNAWRSSGR